MCADCRDLGYVREELPLGHPNFGNLVPCPSCARSITSDRAALLRSLANLHGDDENNATFDGIKNTDCRREASRCARDILNRGGWLTLYGNSGNGKTYIGAAAVNAALDAGRTAALYTVHDLFKTVKDGWSDEKHEHRANHAYNADVLVVDEFEKLQITDWSRPMFQDLYIARYRHTQRATIWIANVEHLETMAIGRGDDTLTGPLVSRMSQYWTLRMTDADARPAIGKAWKAAATV